MSETRDWVLGLAFGLVLSSGVFLAHLGVQQLVSLAPLGARVVSADDVTGLSYNTDNYSQANGHYLSTSPSVADNSLYSWEVVGPGHEAFTLAMEQELGKYDPKFLDEVGLKHVFIVDNIIDRQGQRALGFSETISGNIYLDAAAEGAMLGANVRSTIHHEIGHLLFVRGLGVEGINNRAWQDISDGRSLYGASQSGSALFPAEGFVSSYAMSSVAEDMAEVFAFAMSDGYHQLLFTEIENDEALGEKLEFISRVAGDLGFSAPWQPLASYQAAAGE